VRRRSNVKIHNCSFIDFKYYGVIFNGGAHPPTILATGNEFYNNTVYNCAGYYNGFGRASIGVNAQDRMLIYNNDLNQMTRAPGTNGFIIKGTGGPLGGYCKGLKIYNNKMHRAAFDGFTWTINTELANTLGGIEIYENDIYGSIDGRFETKGDYEYSLYVHNNTIGRPERANLPDNALLLEDYASDVIFRYNYIYNVSHPIELTYGSYSDSYISNLYIQDNVFDEIGIKSTQYQTKAIFTTTGGSYNGNASYWYIDNNVFTAYTGNSGGRIGFYFPSDKYQEHIYIRDNLFQDFDYAWISGSGSGGGSVDSLYLQNNVLNNNGNNNSPLWENGYVVTNLINENSI